ncbi:MAG: hypothetical protein OEU92_09425 [Alphaproteobacteria bacterium]|nr:hypothetical protein [Alphaproteobacteria bacterium]
MSSRGASTYHYGAINRQMQRVANEHDRHLRRAWVERVLEILNGDNLIAQAASGQASDGGLLFECNVAPLVWDDPRIAYRRQQLERSDVTAELAEHEHTIAGKSFKRTRIKVAFST